MELTVEEKEQIRAEQREKEQRARDQLDRTIDSILLEAEIMTEMERRK